MRGTIPVSFAANHLELRHTYKTIAGMFLFI
jgi:hypothetical protein